MAEQDTHTDPDHTGHAPDTQDPNGNTDHNNVDNNNAGKRKRLLLILAVVVVIAAAGYGAYWFLWARFHITTEDAYVGGNVVSISPRISGTVVSIHAEDTDRVVAGDLLITLDDTDARVALEEAKANLAQTVRQVRQLFDQANRLEATVTLRKASLEQARRDYQRARDLKRVRGISTQDFQHAETQLETARASYQEARHQLAGSRAAVAGTTLDDHPQVQQAEASLRQAWLRLQRTRILAPADGYVAQRGVQVGQEVQPASKLMAVVPLEQVWVDANFKETDLNNVRIGQPVELTADLYGDDHLYHGKVAGLAAGTGNAFALLPAQNATGNWIKVVQRVPVRIRLDAEDLEGFPLRVGLSMEATVETRGRDGQMLAESPVSGARFETSVYQRDQSEVDAMIARILAANRGDDAPAS
ncbi:efflux RND transporter periplasmic adaptor subunit [Alloalcanivorax gelatiniphagus]|uniref:HlyD family efflux transporter periplasmic adaptor subunit n=1 Tax=Alloalcanivorax gelatiniphagus TaxID=1194167 RepID=A0ABY2XH28_9GAMM|nr:efflux RND transporter periplasmic adaptor subunit [Alloalcanivorax gelatiniphagus]TMW10976.1 HlyD family efflux transporter periplasmic adaptor subunit [Alloalcanivorax gelatiniphagus]